MRKSVFDVSKKVKTWASLYSYRTWLSYKISDLSNLSYRNILDIRFTCAAWPVSSLVGNIKETFSHNRAQKYRVKLEILFWDFLLLYNHAL